MIYCLLRFCVICYFCLGAQLLVAVKIHEIVSVLPTVNYTKGTSDNRFGRSVGIGGILSHANYNPVNFNQVSRALIAGELKNMKRILPKDDPVAPYNRGSHATRASVSKVKLCMTYAQANRTNKTSCKKVTHFFSSRPEEDIRPLGLTLKEQFYGDRRRVSNKEIKKIKKFIRMMGNGNLPLEQEYDGIKMPRFQDAEKSAMAYLFSTQISQSLSKNMNIIDIANLKHLWILIYSNNTPCDNCNQFLKEVTRNYGDKITILVRGNNRHEHSPKNMVANVSYRYSNGKRYGYDG